MKPEVAQRRIEAFGKRLGEAHLYLAYHAAFPLALTPDLLYRLWANFQRDIHGEVLNIPWIAVADLLLSSLCDEVGHELYEMEKEVRSSLLSELKINPRFGSQRINELSDFLLAYVQQQLDSPDLDTRDFAQAQKWTALAYTQPSKVASELESTLKRAYHQDTVELIRMVSLVETLAEPLLEAGFEPLLVYARSNREGTEPQSSRLLGQEQQAETVEVGSENLRRLKLMVVDDEPENLELLYRIFRRDFRVYKADRALSALQILDTEGEMAVIISDQRMPVMTGTEFLSRTVNQFPDTIRILLTGYTDVNDLVESINSGKVFKYITKPWNPEHLRQVVQHAAETYRVLKQRTNELRRQLLLTEGQLASVPRFLSLGLSVEQIAEALGIDIERVNQVAQQLPSD
jgi:CheY-like chemotaxis protein